MERRKFVRYIGTIGTAFIVAPNLLGCSSSKKRTISTKLIGANKSRGHLIRDAKLIPNTDSDVIEIDAIIVGGGISGLSAAYELQKSNHSNFLLFELNDVVGGNSTSSRNQYSGFPLGAHYLTLPNPDNRPLIAFLKEYGLITNEFKNGTQEYNEEFLCHAPDERLLYRGLFQEGLVPSYGLSKHVNDEINRFFSCMNEYKQMKGNDGLFLFNIPITSASKDKQLLAFDSISFEKFLNDNHFVTEELRWFLDYCCRDDFGAGFDKVSAWSGINYFAGRKSNPSNTIPSNVLTWPEGNGYLVNLLRKPIQTHLKTNYIVSEVVEKDTHALVTVFNCKSNTFEFYKSKKVIIATPSYVTKHILKSPFWKSEDFDNYIHHPWLVTSVVLSSFPETNGLELAWDNVKFGTKGLGYIYNQHQEFTQLKDKYVISVYLAFDKQGAKEERIKMFSLTEEEMKELVLTELKGLHSDIENYIESMTFQQWGHGMVTPYPKSLEKHYNFSKKNIQSNIIRLAHTDYSGFSIFEEGFSQGINAVKSLLI